MLFKSGAGKLVDPLVAGKFEENAGTMRALKSTQRTNLNRPDRTTRKIKTFGYKRCFVTERFL